MAAILTDLGVKIKLANYIKKCPHKKGPKGSLNRFEITVRLTRDVSKTTKAYEIDNGILHLPRYGAFQLLKENYLSSIKYQITDPEKKPLKYVGKLKKNQKTVLKYLVKNHLNPQEAKLGKGMCSLIMKAGRGKSFLAMGAMHALKYKTCIVVPTDKVMFGWKKILISLFPNNTVGLYYGKKKEPDADIIVMMINTAVSENTPQDFLNKIGFVVYDEIHRYCSPAFKEVFNRLSCKYSLGLTATPDRPQKEDIVFKNNIGPVIYADKIEGYEMDDVVFTGNIRVLKYSGHPKYTKQLRNAVTKTNSTPALITQIAADPYRNQMIVEEILKIFRKGHDVFVFSDRLEHLDILQRMLEGNGVKKSAVLTGGAPEDFTRKVFDEAIIILTTYQTSDTGVSIDRMTGLILTTPRRNLMEQKIGRILRIGGDLSIERQVVDIVDVKLSISSQYPSRKRIYKKENFAVSEIETKWEDYQSLVTEVVELSTSEESDSGDS